MEPTLPVQGALSSCTMRLCLIMMATALLSPEFEATIPLPFLSAMTRSPSASVGVTSSILRHSLCSRREVKITMYVRDCGFVTLRTHGCRGHCRSMSFPEWDTFTGAMKTIQYCGCCKPSTTEVVSGMMVNCHGHDRYVRLNMKAARECHCRPCSHGQPGLAQAYDY